MSNDKLYRYGEIYDFDFHQWKQGGYNDVLQDDVLVEYQTRFGLAKFFNRERIKVKSSLVNWNLVTAFKLVDDRFKHSEDALHFVEKAREFLWFADEDTLIKMYAVGFKAPNKGEHNE